MQLIHGDCLEASDIIETGSVDLILTDLPYGTIKGIKDVGHGMAGKCEWDNMIDTTSIMNIADRVLRKNGKAILFAQQPFTNELINKAIPNIPFSYTMIWEKDHFANALTAKKAPLNYYEDILVYSKRNDKWDRDDKSELRNFFLSILHKYGENNLLELIKKEGRYADKRSVKAHLAIKFGKNNARFDLMDEKMFDFLTINGVDFGLGYGKIKEIHSAHRLKLKADLNNRYPSIFNLWEGRKCKSNILKYKKDYDGYHPTQKPVLLLEDLTKTFSNEGDTVIDLTMGSGSTGVACVNTGRDFIGIELDKNYYDIACKRINAVILNERQ